MRLLGSTHLLLMVCVYDVAVAFALVSVYVCIVIYQVWSLTQFSSLQCKQVCFHKHNVISNATYEARFERP